MMTVSDLLEQPCNKPDNINIQQGCYKLLTALNFQPLFQIEISTNFQSTKFAIFM